MEFSITPLDKGPSVGRYVARAVEAVAQSGLDYRVGPMGTVVEGQWDQLSDLLKRCLESLQGDCDRITCSIKLDYRKGDTSRLESKVHSVEQQLGYSIKK